MTVFSIEDELPETTLCGLLIEGAIGRLELQRADRYNALDVQLISEIIQLLDWSAERSVGQRGDLTDANGARYLRVLIVSGHGKHFCAGADIKQRFVAMTPEQSARRERGPNPEGYMGRAINWKPVIAAVHGLSLIHL